MNIEQFSKEHLSAILDALVRVKDGEITYTDVGICGNTETLLAMEYGEVIPFNTYELLEVFSIDWPKHSGGHLYPVPSPIEGEHPMDAYDYTDNLWDGEYGALRYELLDFLIDELTKVVEECNG